MTCNDHDTLNYLRKESVDIYNRLHSINEDIQFIRHVRDVYSGFPILPNLRCGEWYTNPELDNSGDIDDQDRHIPVYFKSTDGHFNNWSFNLRRANLHLLPVLMKYGGLVLVDSTRSGKRMPDAFSKTVPIWCSVINRAINSMREGGEEEEEWDTELYTPPGSVSIQEHHQIENRLDAWVDNLVSSSYEIPHLQRPLRPFWITPCTTRFPELNPRKGGGLMFIPVICVSASKIDSEKRRDGGYTYIQGSGDDHELWGKGLLDPRKFWKHREELISADRNSLTKLIVDINESETVELKRIRMTGIDRVGGLVQIANASTEEVLGMLNSSSSSSPRTQGEEEVYILVTSESISPHTTTTTTTTYADKVDKHEHEAEHEETKLPLPPQEMMHISIARGKRGQDKFLETVLPLAVEFIWSHIRFWNRLPRRISCVCDSERGFDRSVGVAVVLLQVFFDENGNGRSISKEVNGTAVPGDRNNRPYRTLYTRCHMMTSKKTIQKRLEWIIGSEPRANPSRTTMRRVNEYLMS